MTKMSIRNAIFHNNYTRAEATTLRDVYKSYSSRKARAEESILREMDRLNGYGPRIIRGNCYFFSMAFMYPDPGTGAERLRYYTGRNIYDFEITERNNEEDNYHGNR